MFICPHSPSQERSVNLIIDIIGGNLFIYKGLFLSLFIVLYSLPLFSPFL